MATIVRISQRQNQPLIRGYTSIFTIDLVSEDLDFEADHIVGNWPLVYSSEDTLIITENAWDWWWFWGNDGIDEATNIHSFDISESGETKYSGSGRVEAQFKISFQFQNTKMW